MLVGVALGVAIVGATGAQEAARERQAEGPSARERYRRVMESVRGGVLWQHLGDCDTNSRELRVSGVGVSAAEVAGALRRAQDRVVEVIEATRMKEIGPWFGPRADPFAETSGDRMELATETRWMCRLLRADAARCWGDGDRAGCAERITAIVRLGRQLTTTGDAIVAMLAASALGTACDAVDWYRSGGERWSDEECAPLREELARLDPHDPAGQWRTAAAESRAVVAWVRELLAGDDPGGRLDAGLEKHGWTEEKVGRIADRMRELGGEERTERMRQVLLVYLVKYSDRPARGMTADDLGRALAAAESMGEALAAVPLGPLDRVVEDRVWELMVSDRSQIARMVLGPLMLAREPAERMAAEVSVARSACEPAWRR